MSLQEEADLRTTIRKCKAVLGKNPNSETHKELLAKTQKELDKLHGTTKKTKTTKKKDTPKPQEEATATVPKAEESTPSI